MITKADFLLDPAVAFLNHGSFGATPRVLLDVQREWIDRMERQPVTFFTESPALMQKVRERIAVEFNADANDVVPVVNTTYATNVIAHAMASVLQPGDEILTTDHEYGACMRAWRFHCRNTGAVIVERPIPIPVPSMSEMADIIWSGVTSRTRMIFLSHITSPTAIRLPVEELCRRAAGRGIPVFIDGSHIPAQLDLDLSALGAAAFTGNFHKWACTPKGSAFLWVSPAFQSVVTPFIVSWGAEIPTMKSGELIDEHEYLGTRDLSPLLTIPAGLDWLRQLHWSTERRRLREMKNTTMKRLLEIEGLRAVCEDWQTDDLLMGAVILSPATDVVDLKAWLMSEYQMEIVVQRWLDVPILRFSVHLHTSNDDLYLLVLAMRTFSSR